MRNVSHELLFMQTSPQYIDRMEAGELLAVAIQRRPEQPSLVLAISEKGAQVALPLAETLGLPMGLMLVEPIVHPKDKSREIGAVCELGCEAWDPGHGIHNDLLRFKAKKVALESIRERRQSGRPPLFVPSLERERVLIVTDGIASPLQVSLAIAVSQKRLSSEIWVASPVASKESLLLIEALADHVVCPLAVEELLSLDSHYA